MKESIASAPAAVWNRKNLPQLYAKRSGRMADTVKQVPAAVMGFARRQPSIFVLSLAVVAALGFVWYLSERD